MAVFFSPLQASVLLGYGIRRWCGLPFCFPLGIQLNWVLSYPSDGSHVFFLIYVLLSCSFFNRYCWIYFYFMFSGYWAFKSDFLRPLTALWCWYVGKATADSSVSEKVLKNWGLKLHTQNQEWISRKTDIATWANLSLVSSWNLYAFLSSRKGSVTPAPSLLPLIAMTVWKRPHCRACCSWKRQLWGRRETT